MSKVLIVEDDRSIAELQSDYLIMSGFETEICTSGREAVELCRRNGYDCIILDLMLPEMSGYEVLKLIRKESDIPVLIVSALREEIDKIRGLGTGADDYITKPFSPGELVARVKAHMSRYARLKGGAAAAGAAGIAVGTDAGAAVDTADGTSAGAATVGAAAGAVPGGERAEVSGSSPGAAGKEIIKAGCLEINTDSHRVFSDGNEVFLTQKEYELLLHFARHPDKVFGREELFEKIWGLDALGDVSTITVHIAKLREKIKSRITGDQYIETVWGAGYRFRAAGEGAGRDGGRGF